MLKICYNTLRKEVPMSQTLTHTLGLPRMGPNRELKKALDNHWAGKIDQNTLLQTAKEIRHLMWKTQADAGTHFVNVGDFSFYDHVLDLSVALGAIPERFRHLSGLNQYFAIARGEPTTQASPSPMVKWFDTNYHYIVPELSDTTRFKLNPEKLLQEIKEAQDQGHKVKVQLLGPVSYLYLARWYPLGNQSPQTLKLLPQLLEVYSELLKLLSQQGIEWLQLEEPILVLDQLENEWLNALDTTYQKLKGIGPKKLLTTYFENVQENLNLLLSLPVEGIHLDWKRNLPLMERVLNKLEGRILSLGVLEGRNIWKDDISSVAQHLKPLYDQLGDKLWIAPNSSLLHLPWSLEGETLPEVIQGKLAFTVEKLADLKKLAHLIPNPQPVSSEIQELRAYLEKVKIERQSKINKHKSEAFREPFAKRYTIQQKHLNLPLFPTTTIGSFPQTAELRRQRKLFEDGKISQAEYDEYLRQVIKDNIKIQEEAGIDVLVHGEPERNDMVSFFSDMLDGYWQSKNGWVQSYGSRCVRPPLIYGVIGYRGSLGKEWIFYAQSLTPKPVKGMLTGPVTMLKWSFPPADESLENVAYDIALELNKEVKSLEAGGIKIIQIDEPAYREVLPLKKSQWPSALAWASRAFRLSCYGVKPETQIHSHMCYSDFASIVDGIKVMDADVVSIETSRAKGVLFQGIARDGYDKGLGPGLWDIHSPLIPQVEDMKNLIQSAAQYLDPKLLWVNPDCGLKTRKWEEVIPGMKNLVQVAQQMRQQY